jgi:hypothetical protein
MSTVFAGTISGSLAIATILFRSIDITCIAIADTSAFVESSSGKRLT